MPFHLRASYLCRVFPGAWLCAALGPSLSNSWDSIWCLWMSDEPGMEIRIWREREIGWHLVRQDTKVIFNLLCNNCFWFLAVSDSSDLSACLVDALVLWFCSCKYSPRAGSPFFKKQASVKLIYCAFLYALSCLQYPLSFRVEIVIYDFLEKEKQLKHFHKANFCVQKERAM